MTVRPWELDPWLPVNATKVVPSLTTSRKPPAAQLSSPLAAVVFEVSRNTMSPRAWTPLALGPSVAGESPMKKRPLAPAPTYQTSFEVPTDSP